jgi:hypothetical protein
MRSEGEIMDAAFDRAQAAYDAAEPDWSDEDEDQEQRRRERAQIEARRNAEHETRVPLEFCACLNCREARLDRQALEDLPF